jgi:HEAT repeat protein
LNAVPNAILFEISVAVAALFGVAMVIAAIAVALRIRNIRKKNRWLTLEKRWNDALLDVLAGDAEPSSLHRAVYRGEELFFLSFLLRYGRRVTGREHAMLRELAKPWLPYLDRELRRWAAEPRARAVQVLATFGLPDYETAVIAALDDPSPLVAVTATRALARKDNVALADAVLSRLSRFGSWRARSMAALLAGFGPGIAPKLRALLEQPDLTPTARLTAALGLRMLSDPMSADIAASQLHHSIEHPELTAALLLLIAHVGRSEHRRTVVPYLAHHDDDVRGAAAIALGHIGTPDDAAVLRPIVEDRSASVAHRAGTSLVRLGRADVLLQMSRSTSQRALLARQLLAEAGT